MTLDTDLDEPRTAERTKARLSLQGLRLVFGTSRGMKLFISHVLIAFGLVSGVVQFSGQVFGLRFSQPALVTASSLVICIAWALMMAYPRTRAVREFEHPDVTIAVRTGDLLWEDAHLVVGFSDTFDTDITDDIVINGRSLQGQLLHRLYEGDRQRLDSEISRSLAGTPAVVIEGRATKQRGKLRRYPIGTVAVIGTRRRRIFCVAYSSMGNDLITRSSVHDLWLSLGQLWEAIGRHGQLGRVAIPVMGAELARVHTLDRENLLKIIILSFVAQSRVEPICRELTVLIHPTDLSKIDMLEMRAFLNAL
jgi:hypothetical protein